MWHRDLLAHLHRWTSVWLNELNHAAWCSRSSSRSSSSSSERNGIKRKWGAAAEASRLQLTFICPYFLPHPADRLGSCVRLDSKHQITLQSILLVSIHLIYQSHVLTLCIDSLLNAFSLLTIILECERRMKRGQRKEEEEEKTQERWKRHDSDITSKTYLIW